MAAVEMERIVTCTAPVNIAAIKYWGKRDDILILPVNDSISFTLSQDEMCAKTTVMMSSKFTQDRFWLNHKEESISNPRIINCLKEVRRKASKRKQGNKDASIALSHVHIYSVNNFPTAAGLASSAAGYACLVFALGKIFDLEGNLSSVARLGSGSACRSLEGGMVQWYMGEMDGGEDCFAEQIAKTEHWGDLHVIICVASDKQKKVSSTEGMKRCEPTSLMEWRVFETLPDRIHAIKQAISRKDWSLFCDITMNDSNEMHAVCLAASPPCVYMNDTSHAIANLVHEFNACKTKQNLLDQKVCYTFDAGPNACIFVPGEVFGELSTLLTKTFKADLSYNSPSEKYWQGIPIPPHENLAGDLERLVPAAEDLRRHSIKYFIHTKIGDGPRVLPDEPSSHLLDKQSGLPVAPKDPVPSESSS